MKEISVEELDSLLKSDFDGIVVDVRELHERQYGTIRGDDDIVLPLSEIESRWEEIKDFASKPVYVYCRSGGRSARVCHFLEEQGFSDVTNVVGGILAWKKIDDFVQVY